jgi:Fur family transcriptional regulator, ferric uptake regulator
MNNNEKILQQLKKGGYRITKARSAIIDFLSNNNQPLSASNIYSSLISNDLKINRATVYRELVFLSANEVVRRVRFPGKATHYEINSGHYHHLVCMRCNSIQNVFLGKHLQNHERQIYEREKFKVVSHSLEFYGFCNSCNGKKEI